MQKFNRVAKLGHKYAELANKNKIFQQCLAMLTKMTSFLNENFLKDGYPISVQLPCDDLWGEEPTKSVQIILNLCCLFMASKYEL